MEDAILYDRLDKEIFIFGVFDGHGGAEVAQFCANHFALKLKENRYYQQSDYGKALSSVFM
jgi:protein phosphatase 1G